mmetsp:Transcript_20532/g.19865  ORF Transcript_20532/g.19865 Transcript_20532/m.19865 type:complete len:312 (+) Transcript_20532:134-1069(+)
MIISSYTLSLLIASLIILNTSLPVNRCRKTRTTLELKKHVILFLNSDRYDKPVRGQSVKTGTHTYASWKSPNQRSDQRIEDFDYDYAKDDREYSDDDQTEEEVEYDDDEDDDDNTSEEAPSTVVTWARKLYDSVFFYGLDPAPAVQKSNKRKIMKDNDGKKSTSPFFTASEQRVQRYMTSMKNKEDSPSKDKNDNQKEFNKSEIQKNVSKGRQNSNVERDNTARDNDKYRKVQGDTQQFDMKSKKSMEIIIEDLEERLVDMTLELELIDAEILTSSVETNREFNNLVRKRDLMLDLIEDCEIDLVTKKSTL